LKKDSESVKKRMTITMVRARIRTKGIDEGVALFCN